MARVKFDKPWVEISFEACRLTPREDRLHYCYASEGDGLIHAICFKLHAPSQISYDNDAITGLTLDVLCSMRSAMASLGGVGTRFPQSLGNSKSSIEEVAKALGLTLVQVKEGTGRRFKNGGINVFNDLKFHIVFNNFSINGASVSGAYLVDPIRREAIRDETFVSRAHPPAHAPANQKVDDANGTLDDGGDTVTSRQQDADVPQRFDRLVSAFGQTADCSTGSVWELVAKELHRSLEDEFTGQGSFSIGLWVKNADASWFLAAAAPSRSMGYLTFYSSQAGHLDWFDQRVRQSDESFRYSRNEYHIGNSLNSTRVCASYQESYNSSIRNSSGELFVLGYDPSRSVYRSRLVVYIVKSTQTPWDRVRAKTLKTLDSIRDTITLLLGRSFEYPVEVNLNKLADAATEATDDSCLSKWILCSTAPTQGLLLATQFTKCNVDDAICAKRVATWVDVDVLVGNLSRLHRRRIFESIEYTVEELKKERDFTDSKSPRSLRVFFKSLRSASIRLTNGGEEFARLRLFGRKGAGQDSGRKGREGAGQDFGCVEAGEMYKLLNAAPKWYGDRRTWREDVARMLVDYVVDDKYHENSALNAEIEEIRLKIKILFPSARSTSKRSDLATVSIWIDGYQHRLSVVKKGKIEIRKKTDWCADFRLRRHLEPFSRLVDHWAQKGRNTRDFPVNASRVEVDGIFHLFSDDGWTSLRIEDGSGKSITTTLKHKDGSEWTSIWTPKAPGELAMAYVRRYGKLTPSDRRHDRSEPDFGTAEILRDAYQDYFGEFAPRGFPSGVRGRGDYVRLGEVRTQEENGLFLNLARWAQGTENNLPTLDWYVLFPESPDLAPHELRDLVKVLIELYFRTGADDHARPPDFGMCELDKGPRGFELLAKDALIARYEDDVIVVMGAAGTDRNEDDQPVLARGTPHRRWLTEVWGEVRRIRSASRRSP